VKTINVDAQRAMNTLVSVSRYLIFMNRDCSAESLIDSLIDEQIVALTSAGFDISLSHDYAAKWREISRTN
jgi:hypothetical protein